MAEKPRLPGAVIWDLDGTLIDQTGPIVRCYRKAIEGMGYPEPDAQTILRSLGGPLESTLALFVKPGEVPEGRKRFRALFPDIMFDGLIILPGALETMEALGRRAVKQAVLTNKHGETARRVCDHAEFSQHLAICVGSTDTEWNKPDPLLTRHVVEKMGAEAADCCLIGDSPTDIKTAANAGLPCYCVATGAHSIAELSAAGAEAAFDGLPALGLQWALS